MQVSDAVRMVAVPEEEPMRPSSTNIYIVGEGQVLTIDSGEAIDKFRWMLRGYLAAIEQAEIGLAAITHHHFDHSGNLKHVNELLGAEIAVPDNGVKLLRGRLPSEDDVRTLDDGATIDLDNGVKVQVFTTPGHSVDSLCYYIEEDGVLFTGDTILGVGTTVVGDINAYRASLQRLLELPNLRILCPGHGPLIHDARERLDLYVNHRQMREDQILEQLQSGEPRTSWQIMEAIYGDSIDKRLRRAADGNVQAHLESMVKSGVVSRSRGERRKPSPTSAARERLKQRERNALIRKARRYERENQRRAIARQESAPTEMWKTPPTYRLRPLADSE